MPRWHVNCDACDAVAWIGVRGDVTEAWCEGCQNPITISDVALVVSCPRCGGALTTGEPRFEELYGELQNLGAVLHAWAGNPGPLEALLPDRPIWLTDLNPPAQRPDDVPAAKAALVALGHGDFAGAFEILDRLLETDPAASARAHLWHALGIAVWRTQEPIAAEEAFSHVLHREPGHVPARLGRGALRAERGDWDGAAEDFAATGAGREGRWNRGAAIVLQALAAAPGLPTRELLDRARREVGEQSDYWSEHTVGRLLWTALVERAEGEEGAAPGEELARLLRAAEAEFEYDTFWDRALVVHGYAELGLERDIERTAAPLVADLVRQMRSEPALLGPAGAALAAPVEAADRFAAERRPVEALAELEAMLSREDLRRYRVPCARCGRGSIGVDLVEEEEVVES